MHIFRYDVADRVLVIIHAAIDRTYDAQDSDFLSKKNLRLVTAPKMQPSRQELLTLEN
jgi:hypothetical protein